MAVAQIRSGENKFLVSGDLSFSTVKDLLNASLKLFPGQQSWNFDFSGVSSADSAGLALLLEWMKCAKQQSKDLRYLNVPLQVKALAKAAGVDALLAAVEER